MKFVSVTPTALAALLQAASADFDVYAAGVGGSGIGGNSWGYQVYDGVANCDSNLGWTWRSSDDVSGGKYGVRCKGPGHSCAFSRDLAGLEQMEFNFNDDDHHWTLYADRKWGLYDLAGNRVGRCNAVPDPGDEIFCGDRPGRTEGQRKVHCTIDSVTAEINAHRS